MSQHRRKNIVGAAFSEHLSTPSDRGGIEPDSAIDMDGILDGGITEDKNSESAYFARLSEEGRVPLAAVMSFMISNRSYRALSVICQGNNWRKIAFALGLVFHTNKHIPLRVQIACGHDRLRDLVTTCMTDLRNKSDVLGSSVTPIPNDYSRLVHRLFTSHGHQSP